MTCSGRTALYARRRCLFCCTQYEWTEVEVLVRVTLLSHGREPLNTLELGLFAAFEIEFWPDIVAWQFDFKCKKSVQD